MNAAAERGFPQPSRVNYRVKRGSTRQRPRHGVAREMLQAAMKGIHVPPPIRTE